MADSEPADRLQLVYATFFIHGVGILMPWNMFITAIRYFTDYKLSESYIGYNFSQLSNFLQYLTFCSQIPNVAFNWLNIFVELGGDFTLRILWSIVLNLVLFIVTVFLAIIDTSGWTMPFFIITMIKVVFMNMATGIYQNTIFGMASKLPPRYVGAVVLGNSFSGLFTSVVSILSGVASSNIRAAAIYYFITAIFVLLLCLDSYFALPINKFYRHHDEMEKKDEEKRKKEALGVKEKIPYWDILKKASMQCINVFLVFFVTLSVFPAIQANTRKSDKNFFISDRFFVDITCFLTFNLFATIGSVIPTWISWPGPKWLWIPIVMRLIYIPFFLMCNYQVPGVTRRLPVWFKNDWLYWFVAATMALTNGYFTSLAMMYAPGTVEGRYASKAGMFAAAFLISGIFIGILVTFLWPVIIS